jgi:hypothetical protein
LICVSLLTHERFEQVPPASPSGKTTPRHLLSGKRILR